MSVVKLTITISYCLSPLCPVLNRSYMSTFCLIFDKIYCIPPSLLTRETLLFQDKMKWNEILQTCGSDEMDSYPLSINSPLLWQLPVWSHNVTTLILSQLSSTNKTSTAKQVLGNCERMVYANFIGNRLSTFILWIWISASKFYFCTVVLCYQTFY